MTQEQGNAAAVFIAAQKQKNAAVTAMQNAMKLGAAAWARRHGISVGGIPLYGNVTPEPLQRGIMAKLTAQTDDRMMKVVKGDIIYGDFRWMGGPEGEVMFFPLKKDGSRSQKNKWIHNLGFRTYGKRTGRFECPGYDVEPYREWYDSPAGIAERDQDCADADAAWSAGMEAADG